MAEFNAFGGDSLGTPDLGTALQLISVFAILPKLVFHDKCHESLMTFVSCLSRIEFLL